MSTLGIPRQARGHRADLMLAMVTFALVAIGLIMMYSISPILSNSLTGGSSNYYFFNQLRSVIIGLIVWVVATNLSYKLWRRWSTPLLAIAGASLLLLLTPFATAKLGATRWVAIGPLTFQPAELLKLAMIVYLAVWLDNHRSQLSSFREGVVPFLIMVGVACLVIVGFQRDLGTAAVLALAAVGMYVAAGLQWRHFVALVGIGLVALSLAVVVAPHRVDRLTTFLHSSSDTSGAGYQINQALIAVGSGGLVGVGLGQSVQVYGYLPEAANDSIFAVIAEEFGLFGSLIIVALYVVVVYRGIEVARRAPDGFAALLALGVTLWFGVQALINIGAMLSLVPLTGIPLPYISYGGTNLIVSLLGAGILLNISKYTTSEEDYANSRQRRGNGGTRLTDSGYRRRVAVGR